MNSDHLAMMAVMLYASTNVQKLPADRINEALDLAERLLRAAVPKAKAIEDSFYKENSP